jgi:acetyl-CoA synthetase
MTFKIFSANQYQEEYQKSLQDPVSFWADIAQNFTWFKKWDEILDFDFKTAKIDWFKGGKLNITANCLDRHLANKSNEVAIIWEANESNQPNRLISYQELFDQTCQFANLLKAHNIVAKDRVAIYMPMIPEAIVAMLACARIGAIHMVVFAGFSAEALAGRIKDCQAKILITADYLYRGDKKIRLFDIAKEAIKKCDSLENIIIYQRVKDDEEQISVTNNLLIWQDEIKKYSNHIAPAILDAADPLFILYTSGSTGQPKGIMHVIAGYMVYAAYSFANVFNYHDSDLFFCTADIGWITGHSYSVYGPLLNGAKILMFEGIPTYPTPARFWEIIKKHQVNIFYTAPTAIRALMQKGDEFVTGHNLTSLKTLGTVGEPINQEAWYWYNDKIGQNRCAIVDTWWQTETGGIAISSLAHITKSKPSFAGLPLPGIAPILLDDHGAEIIESEVTGNLCFKHPWPGMLKTIWGNHQKCFDIYFKNFCGYYFSGDGAFKSKDGLFRIIGRVDDVINSSGHRLGTAEIENAINAHPDISESAVIGYDHPIKGEGICAFVITKKPNINLKKEILSLVTKQISAIARPDKIYITNDLPKTRSGKIMRRILKKIITNDENLGDISTLVNPEIVEQLTKLLKECSIE